jgi:hypothetical protein
MTRMKEPLKWILAALLVCFMIFSVLGAQVKAQAAPPPPSPLEQVGLYQGQMSSPHYKLDWTVQGTGGGNIGSTNFQVSSTIGQPTVGEKSSAHYESCTGYWCWIDLVRDVFLPMLFKR